MKDQIVMSPNNAFCAVAIPLYRICHEQELAKMEGHTLLLTNTKPSAYAIDCGPEGGTQLMNADFVEKNLIFLGDL